MLGRQRGLVVAVALGVAACAYRAPAPSQAGAGLTLPPGDGRGILERECLNCHELEALALFSDFYDRERWRSLVITMRENGAEVDDAEVEVVADYLARHFGTGVE
ncbi:MAG TPA: cytochrome c [Gammaproteobacteria bacterium]|nr:cytochrome c [Gammaproteobacteria bacterium]